VVLVAPGGATAEGYEYLGTSTNNIGELTAILRAVEWAPATGPLLVFTDSQYAIGVLQKGWKAKANPELIAHAKRAITSRGQVRLEYVRGHAGHALNEKADELARKAVSLRSTKRPDLPAG
jgi:ribonuclease HI